MGSKSNNMLLFSSKLKKLHDLMVADVCKKYELSVGEADLLYFLYTYSDIDTAKKITDILLLPKSYISSTVASLTRLGFISQLQDENDKRIYHLKLTDEAAPIVKSMKKMHNKFEKMSLSDIEPDEMKFAENIMKRITKNIDKIISDIG